MSLNRRDFVTRTTLATLAGAWAVSCGGSESDAKRAIESGMLKNGDEWDAVREQFTLSPDYIHMSALLIASHPRPVLDAIERYRRELDENPVVYLHEQNRSRMGETLSSAAKYLGVSNASDIALTDSTTMGVGLVYNGLSLSAGDEALTTEQDYYVTHESLRLASERKGIAVRQIPLYEEIAGISEDQIVENLAKAIQPQTRVLALTWVHSSTGLKLPLHRISDAIREINSDREEADQILICVDGVHGFGVEDVDMSDLGCDFFMAGCHKWLFGPRGTGLVWGSSRGWERVVPTVPSFLDDGTRDAWVTGAEVTGRTNGRRMSPGGFKPFEHQWALAEAFEFHRKLGKSRIAARTHKLARQLKEGLARMPHIKLYTPMDEKLSAGIVCFDVEGMSPQAVVSRLREKRIIATVTPYANSYARLAPSIRNSPAEIEMALGEIHALG